MGQRVGEGVGDWGYTINCPATVLRSCRYCRIEDIITSGERTPKYGLHDFEVFEAEAANLSLVR